MKINVRKLQGIAPAVALAALVSPFANVQAAPTKLFDTWSVTLGKISPTAGAKVLVNEKGFLQESFTDANNTKLFHTVITATDATGSSTSTTPLAYSDESFVRQDQVSGIMSRQSIRETTAAGTAAGANDIQAFTTVAQLASGWAHDDFGGTTYATANGIAADVDIRQTVWDKGKLDSTSPIPLVIDGDEFSNDFHLLITKKHTLLPSGHIDVNGAVTGTETTLDQSVGMGPDTYGTVKSAQIFKATRLSGTAKVPAAGAITLGLGANATTVNWAIGDDIMLTWIGQQTNTSDAKTIGTTQTVFGFEGFTKTVGGAATKATVSTIADVGFGPTSTPSSGFAAWDPLFGIPAPTSTSLQTTITQPVVP